MVVNEILENVRKYVKILDEDVIGFQEICIDCYRIPSSRVSTAGLYMQGREVLPVAINASTLEKGSIFMRQKANGLKTSVSPLYTPADL